MAVVSSKTNLRPYIEGMKFTIRTDHYALRWLLWLKNSSVRLMRWRLSSSECGFTILYKPDRVHQVTDALSRVRRPLGESRRTPIDDSIPLLILEVAMQNQRRSRRFQNCKVALAEEDTSDPEFKELLVTIEPDYADFVRAQLNGREQADGRFPEELPSPITYDEIITEQKQTI